MLISYCAESAVEPAYVALSSKLFDLASKGINWAVSSVRQQVRHSYHKANGSVKPYIIKSDFIQGNMMKLIMMENL